MNDEEVNEFVREIEDAVLDMVREELNLRTGLPPDAIILTPTIRAGLAAAIELIARKQVSFPPTGMIGRGDLLHVAARLVERGY